MKKGIWLSYDLGVEGDYKRFYAWLDDHDAVPCGTSMAYLQYEWDVNNDRESVERLRNDIRSKVSIEPRNNIYLVRGKNVGGEKKVTGSFLFGKRMSTPWEGYGSSDTETSDEA